MDFICVRIATWAWSHGTPTNLRWNKSKWSQNVFTVLLTFYCPFRLDIVFDILNPPPPLHFVLILQESVQVQHNDVKSYQTILQKACVIIGLPLAMMQSPKIKALAINTVLKAMMRFVSCSTHHCKMVCPACVFIVHHKKGSHSMSTRWSCGRRAKAISVTHQAGKPTISSWISGHLKTSTK